MAAKRYNYSYTNPMTLTRGGPTDGVRSEDLEAVAFTLNGRPQETLDWKTPAEALDEHRCSTAQAGVATTS